MVNPAFLPLFSHYPRVIHQMPTEFSSHMFIAQLAQRHQQEYIAALAANQQRQAPFRDVHSVLAKHLNAFVPQHIIKIGGTIDEDILSLDTSIPLSQIGGFTEQTPILFDSLLANRKS
jgi:hypothetical protein